MSKYTNKEEGYKAARADMMVKLTSVLTGTITDAGNTWNYTEGTVTVRISLRWSNDWMSRVSGVEVSTGNHKGHSRWVRATRSWSAGTTTFDAGKFALKVEEIMQKKVEGKKAAAIAEEKRAIRNVKRAAMQTELNRIRIDAGASDCQVGEGYARNYGNVPATAIDATGTATSLGINITLNYLAPDEAEEVYELLALLAEMRADKAAAASA